MIPQPTELTTLPGLALTNFVVRPTDLSLIFENFTELHVKTGIGPNTARLWFSGVTQQELVLTARGLQVIDAFATLDQAGVNMVITLEKNSRIAVRGARYRVWLI
jgi:hypothetical protein